MRPALVEWLEAHGVPAWFAPDYLTMGGLGALLGGWIVLRGAPLDRRRTYALALSAAYLATHAMAYLLEVLRLLPERLADGDYSHVLEAGRSAYGGLIGAVVAAAIVLRQQRVPLGPFFDRTALGAGVVFACARTGCFLAGCDFGVVTAQPIGVRFPPDSFAAADHVARGWLLPGHPSLPVHPTQLYEAAFGLVSALAIAAIARRAWFAERLLLVWVGAYAVFRYANELLRGDVERGVYLGLSTAQIVSLAVLGLIALKPALRLT